ncbi:MAG: hypothetical protein QM831_36545 [Kofleriaceae bacterium]
MSWRSVAILLALVCCVQRWQACTRSSPLKLDAPTKSSVVQSVVGFLPSGGGGGGDSSTETKTDHKRRILGVKVPAWADRMLPQPGEKLGAYRDRILPLAELAIAPQRMRVARVHDQLPEVQRAALDAQVEKTGKAIEDRVTQAFFDADLQSSMKPMQGVALARDVLDLVDQGNSEMMGSFTPEQREQMSKFDFADYLLFSRHWEDALAPH